MIETPLETITLHFDSVAEGDIVHNITENKFYKISYINGSTFNLISFGCFLNNWCRFKYWFKKVKAIFKRKRKYEKD